MNDPERLDLPSASGFSIIAACPGQPNLRRTIGNIVEQADELAKSGTRIHRARETGDDSELSAEEAETYRAGLRHERWLVATWVTDVAKDGPMPCGIHELRLWLNDPTTLEPALSGKLDVHYVSGGFVLVIDWKTGWAQTLTPSQRNWQLRVQAVLAWREYSNVKSVRVAFVKPKAAEKLDFTDYSIAELEASQRQIFQILWQSKQPDAPRIAGGHCNYCPCKAHCPEAGAYAMLPSVNGSAIDLMVRQMSIEDLAVVHKRALVIGKILEAVKVRLRSLSDEDLRKLGFKRTSRLLQSLTNPQGIAEFLSKYGVKNESIWSALKFSKEKLVAALRKDQNWPRKQAEQFVESRLKEWIVEKESEDSIVEL